MLKDIYLFMRTVVDIITVVLVFAIIGRLDLIPIIYGITLPALWFMQTVVTVKKLKNMKSLKRKRKSKRK
jgi:hypothetical protein